MGEPVREATSEHPKVFRQRRQFSTPTSPTTSGIGECGVLVPVQASQCPASGNLSNCDYVEFGQLCEGDGECGTAHDLDNCNQYDIYYKSAITPDHWLPQRTDDSLQCIFAETD